MDSQRAIQKPGSRALLRRFFAVFGVLAASAAGADVAYGMQRIQLTPTGLGTPYDQMGYAVALFGDTAVVGAPGTQIAPLLKSGVVDVYRLANGTWQQETILVPTDATPDMAFGASLALGQDLLVVVGGGIHTFERDGATWAQVDEFDAAGPLALSGDTLVGANVVYVRAGDGWTIQAQLTGDDSFESMGTAVAIDGDLMAMTSTTYSIGVVAQHVYFYSRSGSTWTREGRFELPIGPLATGPSFVGLSGQTALVTSQQGQATTVHVFDRHDDGTWTDDGMLDAGTDLLVQSLSLDGDRALVGNGDGTAYTFARSGGVWTRELHFNDPSYSGCFVSVALEDTTALVGCPGAVTASGGFGKADVFSLDSDPPTIAAQFDQGNAYAGANFGTAISLSGDTVVVLESTGADIFDGSGGSWVQQAQIRPDSIQMWAVALDADTAAVAYRIPSSGVGAVDILTRTGGSWTLRATLSGSGPDAYGYGFALALEGDTLVVCNPLDPSNLGACYIVERSGSTWSETATLHSVAAGERFGWSVSLSGDTLLVGAPLATTGLETQAGAAYAFVRSQGTWTQQAEMFAPLPAVNAQFGRALAIKGDTAAISAGEPYGDRGAAYVYKRAGELWSSQATLTPPMLPPPLLGAYGVSVAVSDAEDTVVVGDFYGGALDDVYAGVAFVFKSSETEWSYASMLEASPPFPRATYDSFGYSVALSGDTVAVGAPFDGIGGAVYLGSIAETIFADGFDPSP